MKAPIQSSTTGTKGLTFKTSCDNSVAMAPATGRENKPEFHRFWHDEQRRECNFHHAEQSTLGLPVSFSTPKNAIPSAGIQVASKLIIIGLLLYKVTGECFLIAP